MARDLEPWGGDVRLPPWLSRLLDAHQKPVIPLERVHERRQAQQPDKSVTEAADRAAVGPLSELYREGRTQRRQRRSRSSPR